MKKLLKNLSVAIAAMSIFAACSDKDDLGSNTNGIPKRGVMQNIVERSEFSNLIDWQTYAGDDFYRYATGAWQDRTTTAPGRSKGTLQDQSDLTEAYVKKACQQGTIAAFDRFFKVFNKEDEKKKILESIVAKLNDIETNVTTQDQAWQKMAQLMKEGYAAPMDFYVQPVMRKVYPALIRNADFGNTDERTLGLVLQNPVDCAMAYQTAQSFKSFFVTAIMPKWTSNGRCCTGDEPEYVVLGGNTGMTRAANVPDNSPLGKIMAALGATNGEGMAIYTGYKDFNEKLEKLTLSEAKGLMKYAVIDRDLKYILAGNASEMIQKLAESSNSPLSLIMSRHYAETQVPAENKARVTELGERVRSAFAARLENSPWLSSESKAKAKDKLQKMWIFIGWPSSWDANAMVKVSDKEGMTAFELVSDLYKQRSTVMVPALKGKTDADHVLMSRMATRPTYIDNAIYDPINNYVYIYASNMVPPIYDPAKSDAYNYAVMGATTIGHEITHGFDTNGSYFDATGGEGPIFSARDKEVFYNKSVAMKNHFSTFVYGGDIAVNGDRTVGENIADLGGLNNAYDALMAKSGGQAAERLYTAREYFRAFAFGWMEKGDNEYMSKYVSDVHSPNFVRTNGNVYQVDAFYDAFGITGGQLYIEPSQRIRIW